MREIMYKKFMKSRKSNLGIGTSVQNERTSTAEKTKPQSNSNQDLISEIEIVMKKEK